MQHGYKITISGRNIYREIELPCDVKQVKVGTDADCNIRIHKDLFFEPIVLSFHQREEEWCVVCADNLYIDVGDVRKLVTLPLENGRSFLIRYRESGNEVFAVEYILNFELESRRYERAIDISAAASVRIGSDASCQIGLRGDFVPSDEVTLSRQNADRKLVINKTTYGVYLNGTKIERECMVRSGDFFSIADYVFYYKEETLRTEIREDMVIDGLPYTDFPLPVHYPAFRRNTRLKVEPDTEEIEILDPPAKPEKPKNHILTSLLPAASMLLVSGLMAFMGGTGMIVFSAASGAMAVVTAVVGIRQGNKDFQEECKKRIETYQKYTSEKRKEIQDFRERERGVLEKIYLNQDIEKDMIFHFSSDLFDRLPDDRDFLSVRLGVGNIKAAKEINFKKQERLEIEDDLQLIPEKIYQEEKDVRDAPVTCSLGNANAVGIVGRESARFSLLKNMVVDLCARHYHTDVRLFFIAAPENKDKIEWLRFLPHVCDEASGGRNIVCDEESKTRIFDFLYKELSQRTKENKNPHFVVFFYDDYGIQSHPLSKFIPEGSELGITFVFLAETKAEIPVGCSYLVTLGDGFAGKLIKTADSEEMIDFHYREVSDEDMKRIVQFLAPVYTEEISLESTLTRNLSFFEMLNILDVDDLDLDERWGSSDVTRSMAAPLGVAKSGPVYLDLHDKAHGPHGLVAGTTGSGKSEALQTYILSAAVLFHPYEVSFVIIDFKGGGMVNQFRNLPHLLGAITNIDGKEIDRSLRSIKAELQKRQRLFAEADVNHIDKYIHKFKTGAVRTPIPHLILIVDEFAELKAEQPDFMKELISAARIGRSLGVHLILATQKPSGQVDDQIWSNSRFKLCLKVQSQEDSNEVLKSPLAAEIKEPGRAYLQVGNNEIFELFQSAYSGAPAKILDSTIREFTLYSVSVSGKRTAVYTRKKKKAEGPVETQLDAVVQYVGNYCKRKGIERLNNICLPSLADRIAFPDIAIWADGGIAIGIYDDPDNQVQEAARIDIEHKNTFIIGSSQYGKTNLLQGMIRSIAGEKNAEEANIYIIDFGSMVLKNFEALRHVGGVVCSSEDEKLNNLFKLLLEEISGRKEKLISVGVSSFAAYLEAGYTDIPQIFLIIDNMTALIEMYLQDDDSLLSIIREGLSVGISVIAANAQTSGIGYRYLANFSNKIALYCNDSSEYNNLFDHIGLIPDEKPGRCVLELNKRMLECQTYVSFEGEKEIERVAEMQRFVEAANRKNKGKAKAIPCIPAILNKELLYGDFGAQIGAYQLPVGLTFGEVLPFYMDLSQLGMIGICGKENTGHKNFVQHILYTLEAIQKECPSRVVIFDDISRKYDDLKELGIVSRYSLDIEKIDSVIREWHRELEERYESLMSHAEASGLGELLLLIVQNNDVARRIGDDMDLMEKFTDIVTRYKNLNVAVIFANYPNAAISYDAPEPIRMVKQEQHLLFLENLDNLKPFDVAYEIIRANRKKLGTGDAYYIQDNSVTKIKLVKAGK